MHHKTLETKTATVTELGEFTAIAAAYSVDRVGDEIQHGAFAKTISRWQESGKRIPLHYDHSSAAEDIIGYVDPASMEETEQGLFVAGKLDLDASTVAKEAWRSMKNNAVSLSFGYMATVQHKREDGVNELRELDVFEISVVAAPANPDTRFLSLKNVSVEDESRISLSAEAWKLVMPQVEVTEPEDLFPDVKTEKDFAALPVPAKLEIYHFSQNGQTTEDQATWAKAYVADLQSSAVEDEKDEELERVKSIPQDPLVKEAWDLVVKHAQPEALPASEPEPEPEVIDVAQVQREAWALAMKTSG